jgi:hypothetical protein
LSLFSIDQNFIECATGMEIVEQDERMQAIKIIERMLARNQSNREKFERAVFKIAYPILPETEP